jgi:uncharacterized phage protein (TIGR02216 family)
MALGLGALGIAPAVFWAMTPRELDCALAGRMGGRAAVAAGCPPDKRALADLMRRFPDA